MFLSFYYIILLTVSKIRAVGISFLHATSCCCFLHMLCEQCLQRRRRIQHCKLSIVQSDVCTIVAIAC